MVLFYMSKRQGYISAVLGCASGYYIWNRPLKEYYQKLAEANLNKNKIFNVTVTKYPMARNKPFLKPVTKVALFIPVFLGCLLGYRLHLHKHVAQYKSTTAENYANIIYEKQKENLKR